MENLTKILLQMSQFEHIFQCKPQPTRKRTHTNLLYRDSQYIHEVL